MLQLKITKLSSLILFFVFFAMVYFSLSTISDDNFENKEINNTICSKLSNSENIEIPNNNVELNLPDSNKKENDFVVGPGLPAPEDMVYWYVPKNLKDNSLDLSPYFPAISQYSDSMNYTRKTMMTVWYFDEYENMKNGEKKLYTYLKENGNVSDKKIDISEQLVKYENKRVFGSTNLNVTRYESEETSGYFAVIIKPFGDGLDNYFIIYYGTNEKKLNEEIDTIKNLIAKRFYMTNENGYVRGLSDEAID